MMGALVVLIVTPFMIALAWWIVEWHFAPFLDEKGRPICRRCGGEGFDPKDDDPGYRLCPVCIGGDW